MLDKVQKKFLIKYRDSEELEFKELLYLVLDLNALDDLGPDFIYKELVKEYGEQNVEITELDISEIDNKVLQELNNKSK